VALRVVVDPHLAEDVTQNTFAILAKEARHLSARTFLSSWLHRTASNQAANLVRGEMRRRAREQEAYAMQTDPTDSTADWKQVASVLDDALNRLAEADRAVIFLRFFEKKTASDIAAVLSLSEEAAQKRVSRALDRLRGMLSGQGAGLSTTTLASLIAAQAVVAAPVGLSTSVSSAALASSVAGAGFTATTFKLLVMSKLKMGAASALLIAAVVTPLMVQHRQLTRLRDENHSLQEQMRQAGDLRSENEKLSAQLARQPPGLSDAERAELLRLRGEVGPLRRDSQELVRLRAQPPPVKPVAAPVDEAVQRFDAQRARTVNALKVIGLQLRVLKSRNEFKAAFSPEGNLDPNLVAEKLPNFEMNQVELVVADPSDLEKVLDDSPQTIIARTVDPIQTPDGKWLRVYTLADGSVQQRSTENPNEAFGGNWQLVQVKPRQ
jgi:RNA polymerase sigma factor (sigma-70 family)